MLRLSEVLGLARVVKGDRRVVVVEKRQCRVVKRSLSAATDASTLPQRTLASDDLIARMVTKGSSRQKRRLTHLSALPVRLAGSSDSCLLVAILSWSRMVEALVRLASSGPSTSTSLA